MTAQIESLEDAVNTLTNSVSEAQIVYETSLNEMLKEMRAKRGVDEFGRLIGRKRKSTGESDDRALCQRKRLRKAVGNSEDELEMDTAADGGVTEKTVEEGHQVPSPQRPSFGRRMPTSTPMTDGYADGPQEDKRMEDASSHNGSHPPQTSSAQGTKAIVAEGPCSDGPVVALDANAGAGTGTGTGTDRDMEPSAENENDQPDEGVIVGRVGNIDLDREESPLTDFEQSPTPSVKVKKPAASKGAKKAIGSERPTDPHKRMRSTSRSKTTPLEHA